jgi:glycosyltransferase involved in cell wall biosynthesis
MQVLVLSVGDPQTAASTRFRVAQYAARWSAAGVTLRFVQRPAVDRRILPLVEQADVVLNQKCLLSPWLGSAIRSRAKRLIFDFDDAVWTRPGRDFSWLVRWRTAARLRWWLRAADVVTTANGYLAEWAKPHARRLEKVPMTLDLGEWCPDAAPRATERVTVGWAGSPAYIPLLERLEPALAAACAQEPRLHVVVYSGRRPAWRILFEYVPYAPGTEAAFVRRLDIGLLPMDDDPFGRGKSPIKALQYLACGVPVVGRLVGAAHELVDASVGIPVTNEAEWTAAVLGLARDAGARRRLGAAGIARMQAQHDLRVQADRLLAILRG